MSEKIISALSDSAVFGVSPPKPPVYRSKKKLRMEARYFNTTLSFPIPFTHEPRRLSTEKAQAVDTTFPTTKYIMNNNSWFQHAFGNEADDKTTQASSASYNGKTFSGRPKHYYASESGKTAPTNLKGFNQMYRVGDDDGDSVMRAGFAVKTLSPVSIGAGKARISGRSRLEGKEATSSVVAETKIRKRSLPSEFTEEEDMQRGQTRARIEENWEFGRTLARRHVHSLWRDTKAMKKWREEGQQKISEEQQEVKLDVVSGDNQIYEKTGNKGSFLYLQVDVVMPLDALQT